MDAAIKSDVIILQDFHASPLTSEPPINYGVMSKWFIKDSYFIKKGLSKERRRKNSGTSHIYSLLGNVGIPGKIHNLRVNRWIVGIAL